MANNNDSGSFVVGFLFGAFIGAIAAIMMAPQSGEDTRRQIRDKGIELKGQAEEELQKAIKQAEKAAEQARMRMEDERERLVALQAELEARARETVDSARQQMSEIADETKGRVSAAVEQGKVAARKTRAEMSGENAPG